MPGLDITPADPMGTLQDWQQTLSRTSILGEQAKQAPINTELMKQASQEGQLKLEKERHAQLQQLAFEEEVKALPKTVPVFEQLSGMANAAARTGNFGHAEKLINLMTVQQNKESLIEQREARRQEYEQKTAQERGKMNMELLAGVTDTESKRQAEEIYKQRTGEDSPTARYPYSPKLIELAKSALGKKQSALEEELTRARIEGERTRTRKTSAVEEAQERLTNARIRELDSRAARVEKVGGKLAVPTAQDVKAAEAKITVMYPGLPKAELSLAAREVAADAKAIHLQDHGSYADAVEKAVDGRKAQFTTSLETHMLSADEKKASYAGTKPAGAKPATPLPAGIPKGSTLVGRTPQGKLVYRSPDGKQLVED